MSALVTIHCDECQAMSNPVPVSEFKSLPKSWIAARLFQPTNTDAGAVMAQEVVCSGDCLAKFIERHGGWDQVVAQKGGDL